MDAWTTWMRRRARGCIASVLHPGAAAPRSTGVTKGEREEGDDCDVIPTSARGPAGRGGTSALYMAGWLAGPRSGRKKGVGQLVGCRPTRGKKATYLIYSNFLFNSNLDSNSNLNPHK
jgi:hypothetical protein